MYPSAETMNPDPVASWTSRSSAEGRQALLSGPSAAETSPTTRTITVAEAGSAGPAAAVAVQANTAVARQRAILRMSRDHSAPRDIVTGTGSRDGLAAMPVDPSGVH